MIPTITKTVFPEVLLLDMPQASDDRGFFSEPWNEKDFASVGFTEKFVQEGHSRSHLGVIRGLHMQDATAPMGKLVRCIRGKLFDVIVDFRIDSPTFSGWIGVELSEDDTRQVWIPPGFLHGMLSLSEPCEISYKQSGGYNPKAEIAVAFDDPNIAIKWPDIRRYGGEKYSSSSKDSAAPTLEQWAAVYNLHPTRFIHYPESLTIEGKVLKP